MNPVAEPVIPIDPSLGVLMVTPVWYFNSEWAEPAQPRSAFITGRGSKPGHCHATVLTNPTLDVASGKHPPIVTRRNLPLLDRHPRNFKLTEFLVCPATQCRSHLEEGIGSAGDTWCAPVAANVLSADGLVNPARPLAEEPQEPAEPDTTTPNGQAQTPDPPAGETQLPQFENAALQALREHPRFRQVVPGHLEQGIVMTEENDSNRVVFLSRDSKVQLAKVQYISRSPRGYRLRAYNGKRDMSILTKKVAASAREIGVMCGILDRILELGRDAKTKADAARATEAALKDRE